MVVSFQETELPGGDIAGRVLRLVVN